MTTNQPSLRRLAYHYFDQDWDLEAPTPDAVLVNFVRDEGRTAGHTLMAEILQVLGEDRSEDQLATWWVHDLRSQFEPRKVGMTYRQWFTHVLDVLRETPPVGS